ncbi:MAG: hypothetical protein KDB80_18325 [Planctomycetes bacterium]|nr:hypothetical protein [Planctomycetota bacterium]
MIRILPLTGLLLVSACDETRAGVAPSPRATIQDPGSRPTSQPTEPTKFAGFRRLNEDDAVFETAIVRYANDDGAHVSLIASVHIADATHYDELNKEFEKYDALLYELVAPDSYRPKKGEQRKADNPLSYLQLAMKKGLELEFQLGSIDYTPDNFVHADLTPSGFQDAMADRGETLMSIIFDMIARQGKFAQEQRDDPDAPKPAKIDMVKAFRNNEGRHALRLMVGEQLMMLEGMAAGAGGDDDDGTVLLEGRNDRALEVLAQQLAAGKREIGIYYGAAHMPDMEAKLIRDFGFHKVSERTLVAWDITKRKDGEKRR